MTDDALHPPAPPSLTLDTDELRRIVADELKTMLGSMNLVTADKLPGVVAKVVKDELVAVNAKINSLDIHLRDAEQSSTQSAQAMNQVIGKLNVLQSTLDTWNEQAAANTEAVTKIQSRIADIERDLYGDSSRPHNRSVLGELEKIPALITSAMKTEIAPVLNRLTALERLVAEIAVWWRSRRDIEIRVWQAARFVLTSPKWLAVIGGGGAAGALLLELLKALGGGK